CATSRRRRRAGQPPMLRCGMRAAHRCPAPDPRALRMPAGLGAGRRLCHSAPHTTRSGRANGMKIIVIGGTGTIGRFVCDALRPRHEVVTAGSKSGDLRVDTGDSASIRTLFETLGRFDALVSTAGKVHYGELSTMTETEMQVGLRSKL